MSAPTKTLWLHIGSHKTGTSALQSYFADAGDELSKQGFHYVVAGRPGLKAHHPLAWCFSERGRHDAPIDNWRAVLDELSEASTPNLVISSEAFWFADAAKVAEQLAKASNVTVNVVAYIRRPDRYVESLYKQRAKLGRIADEFDDYVAGAVEKVRYDLVLDAWADAFGSEAVIVRLYDDIPKSVGTVRDFLGLIGAPYGEKSDTRRRNPSPSRQVMELLFELGRSRVDVDGERVFFRMMKGKPEYQGSNDLFDSDRRRAFLEDCAPIIERVRAAWFSGRPELFPAANLDMAESVGLSAESRLCVRCMLNAIAAAWAIDPGADKASDRSAFATSPALNELLAALPVATLDVDRDRVRACLPAEAERLRGCAASGRRGSKALGRNAFTRVVDRIFSATSKGGSEAVVQRAMTSHELTVSERAMACDLFEAVAFARSLAEAPPSASARPQVEA